MASRAIAFQATPGGCRAWVLAIATTESTCSGNRTPHPCRMPPNAPSATAASRSTPRTSRRRVGPHHVRDRDHREVRAIWPPRCRIGRAPPVVPRQPPSRFVETTKKWSVSNALPGPIIPSHQPSPLAAVPSRSSAANPSRVLSSVEVCEIPGSVGVAAQRVADQDHVVPLGGEGAVGLVRDADRVQLSTAVERHRAVAGRGSGSRTLPTEPVVPVHVGAIARC